MLTHSLRRSSYRGVSVAACLKFFDAVASDKASGCAPYARDASATLARGLRAAQDQGACRDLTHRVSYPRWSGSPSVGGWYRPSISSVVGVGPAIKMPNPGAPGVRSTLGSAADAARMSLRACPWRIKRARAFLVPGRFSWLTHCVLAYGGPLYKKSFHNNSPHQCGRCGRRASFLHNHVPYTRTTQRAAIVFTQLLRSVTVREGLCTL